MKKLPLIAFVVSLVALAFAVWLVVAGVISDSGTFVAPVGQRLPDAAAATPTYEMAIDQMKVCGNTGQCSVVRIPLDTDEQAVVNGTAEVAVRAVYNADQPGGPVQFLDRIYGRAIFNSVTDGERWFREINLGPSWSGPQEVTITRGLNRCNSVASSTQTVPSILATMDNSTCDGDERPIVVRWVASLRENDVQSCGEVTPVVEGCEPFAPLTVLSHKRQGYQVYYGDQLKSFYQSKVILNKPLP